MYNTIKKDAETNDPKKLRYKTTKQRVWCWHCPLPEMRSSLVQTPVHLWLPEKRTQIRNKNTRHYDKICRLHGDVAPRIHHAMSSEQYKSYVLGLLVIFWLLRSHSLKDWIPVIQHCHSCMSYSDAGNTITKLATTVNHLSLHSFLAAQVVNKRHS